MGFEKEPSPAPVATSSSHALAIPTTTAATGDDSANTNTSPLLGDLVGDGEYQDPRHLSSQPKTFANVFIAIVGAGVLGLPYTFMRTGFLSGAILLLAVAALTFHTMLLLVLSRRRLLLLSSKPISSFGDLALAASGPLGRVAVDLMILLSQAGFCVSYLIFISSTLHHLTKHLPSSLFTWLMLPFQLALNSTPTLTHLAPLSIFADVVDLAAMAIVMVQDSLLFIRQPPAGIRAFNGLSPLFYAIGVAVYSFEGIGMVLPLEAEARNKSKFPLALGLSMALIAIMYAAFGVLGYLAFGDATSDIITTNLGSGLLTTFVQVGLCVNLFFSFPLMMNPVYEVLERRFSGKQYNLWLRWGTVVGVALVALCVPNFADFLSLVGSSVCSVLGFVLPALFHLRVFKGENGLLWVASDVLIMAMGVFFAVAGTYTSLVEIFSVKA